MTEANQSSRVIHLNPAPHAGEDNGAGKLAMWFVLASLGMLFLASIVGYLVVRLRAEGWPPPGIPGLPAGLWGSTAILAASGFTIHRALKGARSGNQTGLRKGLYATFALGLIFLVIQIANWWQLLTIDIALNENLYAFTFFMLTGLHAAHVIGGLVPLGVACLRARAGRYSPANHNGVLYCAMYWHFLDGVWIVMFLLLLVFS